jgi:peptidoglycan/xylan/chitin deacetylase (PgdA/CDA1 family)
MIVEGTPMGIKGWLRSIAGTACHWSGVTARVERANLGTLVVPCYHRILPAARKANYFLPDLVVTPEAFRIHCAVLADYYEVWPLSEALEALETGAAAGRRLAAITFDDGYEDNVEFAAPILAEFELRATFFVVTDCIDRGVAPWYDRAAVAVQELFRAGRLPRMVNILQEYGFPGAARVTADDGLSLARHVVRAAKALTPTRRRELVQALAEESSAPPQARAWDQFMSWDQVRALAEQGHEIGSHSHTHEMLTQLDEESLRNEVEVSRLALVENVPRERYPFCYPNGDVDDGVAHWVESTGYSCAVTVENGTCMKGGDRYRRPRRFMHEDRLRGLDGVASTTLVRMELCGALDALKRHRPPRAPGRFAASGV